MNHGGGESSRVNEKVPNNDDAKKNGGGEFAFTIARMAVAQVCESAGFQGFQQTALDKLSDVALWYIRNIGRSSQYYANLSGRAESNLFDVMQALEELGSSQGFTGAADVDHCLLSSGIVRDIVQYVGKAEDIPFAYSIPTFPAPKESKLEPSCLQSGEDPPGEHIPDWLPLFPDPKTYIQLPTGDKVADDSKVEKNQYARQQEKMDGPSLNLHEQFTSNGSERLSSAIVADGAEAKQVNGGNQFLNAPLRFGEKEVSHSIIPSKLSTEATVKYPVEKICIVDNHVSVLETFRPAIEAMASGVCDSEEGQMKSLSNQRPSVHFKIGVGKKLLGRSLYKSPQNKDLEEIGLWFSRDNEKDEKKRRAEKILKQSEENTGELTQL